MWADQHRKAHDPDADKNDTGPKRINAFLEGQRGPRQRSGS